jgi:hypothetical protein
MKNTVVNLKITGKLLDELELCFEDKWVEDRLGGYIDTRLNRKKARKVIETWLKKSFPASA